MKIHPLDNRCRICGCTEDNPCISGELGPCWWVGEHRDVCSHCTNFLDDQSIERPEPRPLTKFEKAMSDNATTMVIRPQFNQRRNGWIVVMYTGRGWTTNFSSKIHESKEKAYLDARQFALKSSWYVIVD